MDLTASQMASIVDLRVWNITDKKAKQAAAIDAAISLFEQAEQHTVLSINMIEARCIVDKRIIPSNVGRSLLGHLAWGHRELMHQYVDAKKNAMGQYTISTIAFQGKPQGKERECSWAVSTQTLFSHNT